MTTISLKLPQSLLRELETEAQMRGVAKSAIIRESLEAALRKGRKPKKKSCLDLMEDLVGHFEGPPDLSMNKRKYLREALSRAYGRQRPKNHR